MPGMQGESRNGRWEGLQNEWMNGTCGKSAFSYYCRNYAIVRLQRFVANLLAVSLLTSPQQVCNFPPFPVYTAGSYGETCVMDFRHKCVR